MAWRPTKLFFQFSWDAPSFFASVLWWCHFSVNTQSSWRYLNLSKSLAHPRIEWYCMSHSAVSWYFIGSPSRITFVFKFLVNPPIECHHAAHCARAELLCWWDAFPRDFNLLTKLMDPSQYWMILAGPECGLTWYIFLEPGTLPGVMRNKTELVCLLSTLYWPINAFILKYFLNIHE